MKFLEVLLLAGFALASAIPVPESCSCTGGECVVEDGKEICKCEPGFGVFEKTWCLDCDCGPNGGCTFEGQGGNVYLKTCFCLPGYVEKSGECVDADVQECVQYVEDLFAEVASAAEDGNLEDLKNKLKERYQEILEKLKDAIEKGKVVSEDTLEKLKEIRSKLKDLKVEISEKAKELIERLKEKAKDYWKKILDKLNPDNSKRSIEDELNNDSLEEIKNKLKERYEEFLEKLKDAIEKGKVVKEDYIEKLQELKEKLKDLKVDLGNRAKELIEKLKEKAKDYWQRILDKLNPDKNKRYIDEELYADENLEELKNKLKERYQEILEKLKDAIEKGKVVSEDTLEKLKEIRGKLRDLKVEITEKAKELLEKLKEKAKDYWKRILDKLNPDNNKRSVYEELYAELIDIS